MAKEKAGEKPDGLVPQEHGGAIYQGPAENPVAGSGRPPSAIRRTLRQSFDDRIPVLEKIADGEIDGVKPSDRIAAIREMARLGFNAEIPKEEVRDRLVATLDVIQHECDDELAERIVGRLHEIWKE